MTDTRPRATASDGPGRPELRDVLGIPVLPPASMTAASTRVRGWLARRVTSMAPPPAQIVEASLAGLEPAVLAALCRLGVPDHLSGRPTVDELAVTLGVDPHRLTRLLRFAHTRGWVRLDRAGGVRATRFTRFLRRDHPGGWRAWPEFAMGPEITAALARLDRATDPDGDPFAEANGDGFFGWMRANPDRHVVFDAAMAAGARMHGLLLAHQVDWTTSRRVCDIGGGDGTLLETLIAHQPHLHGIDLELPEVVARAPARHQVTTVAGDAFAAVPAGCDTYLFVNVLHDWNDDDAIRLLTRAGAAARPPSGTASGRVLVLESRASRTPRPDIATLADTLMLALTPGGRERTTQEMATLAERAGLRLRRTHGLVSGDVIHELEAR